MENILNEFFGVKFPVPYFCASIERTDEYTKSTVELIKFDDDGEHRSPLFSLVFNKKDMVFDSGNSKSVLEAICRKNTAKIKEYCGAFAENFLSSPFRNMELVLVPIAEYIYNKNKYSYDALKRAVIAKGETRCNTFATAFLLRNIIVMAENIAEAEIVLKTNPEYFKTNVYMTAMETILETGRVSAMPYECREFVNKSCFGRMAKDAVRTLFKDVSSKEDGNMAVIIKNYLSAAMPQLKGRDVERSVYSFASSIDKLVSVYNYNSKKVLEYIIRQSFFNGKFDFPSEEASLLCDYVKIAEDNSLNYDRFPSNVYKAHNLMAKNVVELSPEERISFKENCDAMKKYECEAGDYTVIIPSSPEDVVSEGNALSHCVGSYVKSIANGEAVIAFLRKKDAPQESLYTIEIKDSIVVEAKGEFNSEVPEDVNKIISEIQKKWRKEVHV